MAQAIGALNPNAVSAPSGDAWWGGFVDKAGDLFSSAAGAYLEYERIQAGQDATGASQQPVASQPEHSSQINPQPMRGSLVPGVSNQMLMIGALGVCAVVLLLKK
ncbi:MULTISPECIES: hypothetical protein [Grimontia]|uniref:Uncharacterized protein n=1 Tax=Grimontia marina TaxID=646534 RepID=A0A128EY21_9GAMM|nr:MULTISPECIES: hypothetical protein [Grimontia]WRV98264.1 hypothetical protein VP504_02165 [Grimontia sp. NTOU-MAR1]CZF79469.1 hypothetical protein GMA8713_00987 [Grimontia marina]